MIPWRTSQMLLLGFVVQLGILGVALLMIVERGGADLWEEPLAFLSRGNGPAATAPPVPDGVGHPIEIPRYPVVEIHRPAASIFDPAA